MIEKYTQLLLCILDWKPQGISHHWWIHPTYTIRPTDSKSLDDAFNITFDQLNAQPTTYTKLIEYANLIKSGNIEQLRLYGVNQLLEEALQAKIHILYDEYFNNMNSELIRPKLTAVLPTNLSYSSRSIVEPTHGIIAHGVNCRFAMGSGVARALFMKWPLVRSQYLAVPLERSVLGEVDYVNVGPLLVVANCYTQETFGSDGKRYASLDAVRVCLDKVFNHALQTDQPVHLPKIASDLGGLSWGDEVLPCIHDLCFKYPNVNVTVYVPFESKLSFDVYDTLKVLQV